MAMPPPERVTHAISVLAGEVHALFMFSMFSQVIARTHPDPKLLLSELDGPKLASSIANARRISGSASASRLVSRRHLARLPRQFATSGCSRPKLASAIERPLRIKGSASASRLVACSNMPRLLRSLATCGWSGP
jgi:hypothetical protein